MVCSLALIWCAKTAQGVLISKSSTANVLNAHSSVLVRGEPERAPNTRGTGSGFICIYLYVCLYVCGVIISVRRELNYFERVR